MEITRRSVLSAALQEKEMELKTFSVGFRGLEARRGCQEQFERYQKECRILRELIQALDNEKVRAAIAEFLEEPEKDIKEWQKDVMDGKKTELFVLKGKYKPKCCIECFELRYKYDKEGNYDGHICGVKPELSGDYEKCNKGRMEGCPIWT